MVASRPSSDWVPISFLAGASCLLPERPRGAAASAALTPAEQRVLALLRAGLSNKEISAQLDRAEPTIKNQVASILRKHGVPSRARLLALWR